MMMKRNFILTSLLILSLTSLSFSETIKISGGQTAGTGVLFEMEQGELLLIASKENPGRSFCCSISFRISNWQYI
jgi:hypothetical protein